jgi:probable H4MPT-linked C1 transfer pathway protein
MISGVDIGQTCIKITTLQEGDCLKMRSLSLPFEEKGEMIEKLVSTIPSPDLVVIAQTMCFNRELFASTKEGTHYLIDVIKTLYGNKARYVGVPYTLYSSKEAKEHYLEVTGRAWVGTCYAASYLGLVENGLVIDCGAFSTDIVPVIDSTPVILDEHDMGYTRTKTGELLLSGLYFTHVPSLSHTVVLDGEEYQVNPSTQAMSFDIYVTLGMVSPEDVIARFRFLENMDLISFESAVGRMYDVLSADKELLTRNDAKKIAQFLMEKQMEKTEKVIYKVLNTVQKNTGNKMTSAAIAGAGKDIILRQTLENTALDIVDIEEAASKAFDMKNSHNNCETSLGCALIGHHTSDNNLKF